MRLKFLTWLLQLFGKKQECIEVHQLSAKAETYDVLRKFIKLADKCASFDTQLEWTEDIARGDRYLTVHVYTDVSETDYREIVKQEVKFYE